MIRYAIISIVGLMLVGCSSAARLDRTTPLQSMVGHEVRLYVNDPRENGAKTEYWTGTVQQVTDGWLILEGANGYRWVSTSWIKWVSDKPPASTQP